MFGNLCTIHRKTPVPNSDDSLEFDENDDPENDDPDYIVNTSHEQSTLEDLHVLTVRFRPPMSKVVL